MKNQRIIVDMRSFHGINGESGEPLLESNGKPVRTVSEIIHQGTARTLKYASLITLTVQNAALSLTMRLSRTQVDLFIPSTAVILAELIKLLTCIFMVRIDEGSTRKLFIALNSHIIKKPGETLKVAVPSIVYYIQNNLIYIGATHLDAATCQVTYQLKILTTAILSVLMLGKRLNLHQWIALLILFVGVAVVQLEQLSVAPKSSSSTPSTHATSPLIGFLAILGACCLSGFAGVYFEKILKSSAEVSLWIRNIQLSAIAVPFGLAQLLLTDGAMVGQMGFFFGYSFITWTVILLQAQGGLLVAVVVKYADNILKGFATSLAIILSSVVSVYCFDFHLSRSFALGASLVIFSIFLYGKKSAPPSPVAKQ